MKIPKQYLSILNACLVTLALAPQGSSQAPLPSSQEESNKYPQIVVDIYMDRCVGDRTAELKVFCACTIEEIQASYTIDEFIAVGRSLQSGKTPPEKFTQIIQNCLPTTPRESEQRSN